MIASMASSGGECASGEEGEGDLDEGLGGGKNEEGPTRVRVWGCSYPSVETTGRRGMAATAPSVAMAPVDHCRDPPV